MRPFWRQVRVKIEPGIGQQVTLNNTLKTLKIKRTARETAVSFSKFGYNPPGCDMFTFSGNLTTLSRNSGANADH